MKKLIRVLCVLVCVIGLVGCNNVADNTTETEAVPKDYGKVIELAKTEFKDIFKEFEDIQIEETTTMTRTSDEKEIVVQIRYSSKNGNGVYGFVYNLEDAANPELILHGENVTIEKLLD